MPAPYADRLPHEETTLAETLKQNGYATFFAGKWHLGPKNYWPENHGFDVNKGGIREPMIVRAPGITKPGGVCHQPVTSTDFYPTMLELAGIPLKPNQHKDGKSFVPLLKGKEQERGPIFWHYPHYGNQGGAPSAAVRDGDWKLIKWYEDGKRELFNLKNDIGEKKNLADQYPKKAHELHNKLKQWLTSVEAKRPSKNPNYKSG